jgi:hypothetical protein
VGIIFFTAYRRLLFCDKNNELVAKCFALISAPLGRVDRATIIPYFKINTRSKLPTTITSKCDDFTW